MKQKLSHCILIWANATVFIYLILEVKINDTRLVPENRHKELQMEKCGSTKYKRAVIKRRELMKDVCLVATKCWKCIDFFPSIYINIYTHVYIYTHT